MASLGTSLRACYVLVCCIMLFGCVSTSLEDAAPQRLTTENLPTAIDQPSGNSAAQDFVDNTDPQSSKVDIPARYDEQGFPTFAETPRGEVDQLSSAEKIAIETRMTELLLSRAKDGNVRAGFEAKLRRLRNLAKTHEQNADAIISQ